MDGFVILGAASLGGVTLGGVGRCFATFGAGGAGIGAIFAAGLGGMGARTFGAMGFGGAITRGFVGVMAATLGVANLGAISFGGGGAMTRFGLAAGLGAAASFAGRLTTGFAGRGGVRDCFGGMNFDWGGFVIDGAAGSICFAACLRVRVFAIERRVSSGGNVTFDFGGSFGGGSSPPRFGAKAAVAGPVASGVKGRSILGKVCSGPNLSKTVRSTMTLGRLDPGE
ncbi:MAG: hypothetical protein HOM25_12315 [Rhodospirillaceae bacterium]|nr:hypothetical protein [Rhodospirillaceae bacterium]MBT5812516.1 hypothetical protein [Rhodospirillaceae bacterium]